MSQSTGLIQTLKQALRARKMTYAEIAQRLDMSEANVKRMFALERFSLERLEQVCGLIQLELTDLMQLYEESRQRITQLSLEQEKELTEDIKLLLVAVSARNRLGFDDIINNYHISESECIRCLAKLDRLKIIDLLPGNRIKLRIDEHFMWIPDGPIEQFFEKQIQAQFLNARFKGELSQRLFLYGLLSERSTQLMQQKMQTLAQEFAELHRKDSDLPYQQRHNIGLVLALRPWELQVFKPLIRAQAK